MSIGSALASATSGLAAASRRADIVANNVANAQTPGYARRVVNVSENVLAGSGAGVTIDGVSRITDPTATANKRRAESAEAFQQAAATTYASFNTALGEPGDAFSLFTQYQQLETSLRSLSQTPESQPLQSQALDAARTLTATFNRLSSDTQNARQDADTQIAQQVDFVNDRLKQVEKLNNEISLATGGGRDATALEDQRKVLIDEISRIIPVREVPRNNNKIDLITDEGTFLLAAQAREIEFTPGAAITPEQSYAGGDLSGLTVEGTDITPGGSGTFSVREGSLAGLFQIRDDIAPEFQQQIDALARDVIERFENIDPTLAPGDPGLFTDAGAAFDPTAEVGLAGRIAVNAAADPDQGGAAWRLRDGLGATTQGPPGAAEIVVGLLDALTALRPPPAGTGLGGQLSAAEAAANVTSAVGASRISAETRLAATASRAEALRDAELTATGVDTDQELQQLLLIEQAYAANARVVQVADEMIRRLMEL